MFWHLVLSLYSSTSHDFPNAWSLLFLYMLFYLKLSKSTQNIFLHKPSIFSLFPFMFPFTLFKYWILFFTNSFGLFPTCQYIAFLLPTLILHSFSMLRQFSAFLNSLFLTLSLKSVYHQKSKKKKHVFFSNKLSTILLFINIKNNKKNMLHNV